MLAGQRQPQPCRQQPAPRSQPPAEPPAQPKRQTSRREWRTVTASVSRHPPTAPTASVRLGRPPLWLSQSQPLAHVKRQVWRTGANGQRRWDRCRRWSRFSVGNDHGWRHRTATHARQDGTDARSSFKGMGEPVGSDCLLLHLRSKVTGCQCRANLRPLVPLHAAALRQRNVSFHMSP